MPFMVPEAEAQSFQNHTVEITIGDYDPNWDTPNQVPCAPQTCYTPVEITINVGDSVTWENTSSQWYIIRGNFGGLVPWYSGNYVGTGGFSGGHVAGCDGPGHLGYDMCGTSGYNITSWTHTFVQVGTYQYHDWYFQNYPQRPEGVVHVVEGAADTTPPVVHVPYNVTVTTTASDIEMNTWDSAHISEDDFSSEGTLEGRHIYATDDVGSNGKY